MFKVRATAEGEHDLVLYYEGDVFVIGDRVVETQEWDADGNRLGAPVSTLIPAGDQFQPRWMERVPDDTPLRSTTAQEALDRATAAIKLRRDINGPSPTDLDLDE